MAKNLFDLDMIIVFYIYLFQNLARLECSLQRAALSRIRLVDLAELFEIVERAVALVLPDFENLLAKILLLNRWTLRLDRVTKLVQIVETPQAVRSGLLRRKFAPLHGQLGLGRPQLQRIFDICWHELAVVAGGLDRLRPR